MRYVQFTAARADNGVPLPRAQAFVYLTGTQTLATLFAQDAVTSIGNPATADDNGLVQFSAADGTYDIQITSVDGTYLAPLMVAVQIYDLASYSSTLGGMVTAAQAILNATVNGLTIYQNAYTATLPQGVVSLSSAGVATGSGGTPGTYTGGVSGGPSGFAWSYTIGSDGKIASYVITNPGLATSTTAPTLSYPSGGITGATVPVATVSSKILVGQSYWALSSDSKYLLGWANTGTGSPVALLNPDGTQASLYGKAAIDAFIATLNQYSTQTIGRPTTPVSDSNSSSVNTSIIALNGLQTGTIQNVLVYTSASSGSLICYRVTLSGTTATCTAVSNTVNITSGGLQTLDASKLGSAFMNTGANEYLVVRAPSAGGLMYASGAGPDGLGFGQVGGTGFTVGSTQTINTATFANYRFQVQVNVQYVSLVVNATTFAALSALVNSLNTSVSANTLALSYMYTSIPQTIGRPLGTALVDGTNGASGSAYAPNVPITNPGNLASIDLFAHTAGTMNFAKYTKSGTTMSLVAGSQRQVTAAAVGANTFVSGTDYAALPVAANEYIGYYAGTGTIAYSTGAQDSQYLFFATTGGTAAANNGYLFEVRYNITASVQTVTAANLSSVLAAASAIGGNTLSLSNVDKIAIVSNSYNEAAATLLGKSPVMNVSALSEYNFANFSSGGQTMSTLATLVAGGSLLYGASFKALAPRYAIICENQNSKSTQTDAQYYAGAQTLIDSVRGLGAQPIVMSEWGSGTTFPTITDGEQRNLRGMRSIADANGLLMIDGTSKSRTMNRALYASWYKSNHPGVRVSYIVSDAILAGLRQLHRPLRSMKIFRVRGTVTPSGPSDLVFRFPQDRTRLFKEILIGQLALSDGYRINYDLATALYDSVQTQADEYFSMASGGALSLGTYSLVDCVLPIVSATGVTVTISDTTCTVYGLKKTSTGMSWVQLSLLSGVYIVPDGSGIVDRDRLSLLVYKSSGVSLTGSPVVTWTGGTSRVVTTPIVPGPPRGIEMLTTPYVVASGAVASGWTNTGGLGVKTLVDGSSYLPGSSTGVVEVTSSAGLSQAVGAFTSSDDPQEIVVRVWCRRCPALFTPVQTTGSTTAGSNQLTVSSATGLVVGQIISAPLVSTLVTIPNNPATTISSISGTTITMSANAVSTASGIAIYSADPTTAPITQETCDTGTLLVTLSGASGIGNASAPLRAQAGLNWTEVEFRSTIEALTTNATIDVRSADLPIEIAKVSVRLA